MGPVAFVGGGVGGVIEADLVAVLELLDGVAEGVEAVELVEPVRGVRICVFFSYMHAEKGWQGLTWRRRPCVRRRRRGFLSCTLCPSCRLGGLSTLCCLSCRRSRIDLSSRGVSLV